MAHFFSNKEMIATVCKCVLPLCNYCNYSYSNYCNYCEDFSVKFLASALKFPSVQIKKKVGENKSLLNELPVFSRVIQTEMPSACRPSMLCIVYCLLFHHQKIKQQSSIKKGKKSNAEKVRTELLQQVL